MCESCNSFENYICSEEYNPLKYGWDEYVQCCICNEKHYSGSLKYKEYMNHIFGKML